MGQNLEKMSLDELWALHERVTALLAKKLMAEKAALELRLQQLQAKNGGADNALAHGRRRYPKLAPKYQNPERPAETWAGRGKEPRWLREKLKSGKRLDDFRIKPSSQSL